MQKKKQICLKLGHKKQSSKSHSGNEGARTRGRWGHSGNKNSKNNQVNHKIFIKLIIVHNDALFELNLAIICFVCFNNSQVLVSYLKKHKISICLKCGVQNFGKNSIY